MKLKNTKNYKVEIAIGISVIFIIAAFSGMSLTRTITDSSDTVYTYIKNSQGNYWEVDGTADQVQIQAAIDDVGTYGYVWVGCDTTISAEIDMDGRDGVLIDFEGHTATLSGDISFINFTNCNYAGLQNVDIEVSTQTGAIIAFFADTDGNRVDYPILSNIHIQNTGGTNTNYNGTGLWVYKEHNFTGIEFNAPDVGVGRIFEGLFEHIIIEGPDIGFLFTTAGAGYINGNTFNNVYFDQWKDCMMQWIEGGSNGCNLNTFTAVRSQTAIYSAYGLKEIGGNANVFESVVVWDWETSDSNVYAYWVGSDSLGTTLQVHDVVYSTFDEKGYLYDEGLDTKISAAFGEPYNQDNYDYTVFQNYSYTFAKRNDLGTIGRTGTNVFSSTDSQLVIDTLVGMSGVSSIFFKEGTYAFDGNVGDANMKDITFIGEDKHNTIFTVDGVQLASGMFYSEGEHNLTFKNICFDGSGATGASSAIYFGNNLDTYGLTVDNCVFLDWDIATSYAIRVRASSDDEASNIKIINSDFRNCDYGVHLDGDADPSIIQYADVSHNYFSNCLNSIEGEFVRNSTISNNHINSIIGSSDGIILDDCINVVVDGNTVAVVDDGIVEEGAANFNMIYGNILLNSGDPLTTVGGSTDATLNLT